MSNPGENWIVPSSNPVLSLVQSVNPGANVTITGTPTAPIVNASGVVQSITAGANVTITGTPTAPIVNASADFKSQVFGNKTKLVNTLSGQDYVASLSFTTVETTDGTVSGSVVIGYTLATPQYNIFYDIDLDGTILNNIAFSTSIAGTNVYNTTTGTVFYQNLAPGNHTLRIRAITNAPAGFLMVFAVNLSTTANPV